MLVGISIFAPPLSLPNSSCFRTYFTILLLLGSYFGLPTGSRLVPLCSIQVQSAFVHKSRFPAVDTMTERFSILQPRPDGFLVCGQVRICCKIQIQLIGIEKSVLRRRRLTLVVVYEDMR